MTNAMPSELLEIRAAEQRQQLHRSVEELKGAVREKLDVKTQAREHIVPASAAAGVIALLLGYGVAGMFYPRD